MKIFVAVIIFLSDFNAARDDFCCFASTIGFCQNGFNWCQSNYVRFKLKTKARNSRSLWFRVSGDLNCWKLTHVNRVNPQKLWRFHNLPLHRSLPSSHFNRVWRFPEKFLTELRRLQHLTLIGVAHFASELCDNHPTFESRATSNDDRFAPRNWSKMLQLSVQEN